MTNAVHTGLVWILKIDLTPEQVSLLKSNYTYYNPKDDSSFSSYIELPDRIGIPGGDKHKLKDIVPDIVIQDKRIKPKFSTTLKSKLKLRDYQQDTMTKILEYINKGGTSFNLAGEPGCVDGDTEFLTPTGWKKIKDWDNDEVLECNDNFEAVFSKPKDYIKAECSEWYDFKSSTGKLMMRLSGEHTVPYISSKGNLNKKSALDLYKSQVKVKIPSNFTVNPNSKGALEYVAIQPTMTYDSITVEPTNDYKYCFTTSTGMWVARKNGFIFITGNSGKSFMLANLLVKLGTKTLIIAHLSSLTEQLREEIENVLGIQATVLTKDIQELGDINIGTSQLISKNPHLWYLIKHGIGCIVVDEAESLASLSTMRIFQRAYAKYHIFVSATFTRSSDSRTPALMDFSGGKKFELVNNKLITPQILFVRCNETFIAPSSKSRFQKAKSVFFSNPSIHDKVVRIAKTSVHKNRQVLVACDIKATQEIIKDKLNAIGIRAETFNSDTPAKTRKQFLEEFDEGKIKVIIGMGVLNAGLSIPKISTIIRVSTPNSTEKLQQLIGRGRRDYDGKDGCFVVDLVFNGFNITKRLHMYMNFRKTQGWKLKDTTWQEFQKNLL